MKKLLIFFLLASQFAFGQTKITLTVPSGPGGGVSNVSVNTANGFSGTVSNPTTTPAITIATNQTGLLYGNGTSVTGTKIGNDFTKVNDSLFLYRKANVLDFGAVADGTTNNTAAFQAAVNTGLPVYVPSAGTFLLSTSVTLQPGQLLYGDGFGSIIKITANTRAIVMDSAARVTGIKFVGNGKAGSGSFNTGISLNGSPGAQVDNCMFTDFAGDPVNNGGGGIFGSVIFTSASDGARISNCYFLNNDCGLNLPARAEYVTVDGNTFGANTCAILAIAGNTIISNNIIQNNTTAIKVLDGTNNAHSVISNNLINHNVYPYWFEDIDFGNGMSVEGNDCFYGGVVFINVSNLRITGDVWHHMDSIHLDNTSFISFTGGFLGEDLGTTTPITINKYNGAEDMTLFGVTRSDVALPNRFIDMQQDDSVFLKGPLYHKNLSSGVGTKAVRYDPSSGRFTHADTTTGGGMTNPMTTSQDIIVGGASGTPTRLGVGTNGQRLGVSGGNVTWVDNDATWNGLFLNTLQTSSTSVTLSTHGLYTYVGSADATFTLPALSSNLNRMYFIKNSSAFNVTVQRAGSDDMFTTTTVTSIVIPAGSSRMIGGTTASGTSYWHVMDLSEGTGSSITRTTGTTASSATPAPTGDAIFNTYTVTALATNATFGAPTGTPVDQNEIRLRITDNGTSRTLAWNAIYDEGADIALPTATVVSETIYLAFVYNSATSKWQLVGKTGGF